MRYDLEKIGKKLVFWALARSRVTITLILIDIGSWLMAYLEGNT